MYGTLKNRSFSYHNTFWMDNLKYFWEIFLEKNLYFKIIFNNIFDLNID